MDDGWVDYEPPQASAPPKDDWVDYQPAPPPRQRAAPSQDGWVDYQPEKPREPPPEAEGMLATGLRSFAHEAPAVAAGAAGALTGAGIGAVTPIPGGALAGSIIGGLAGGYAGSGTAEEGLKLMGADDSVQRAINAKANPWSAAAGQFLAQGIGFGIAPASTAVRLAGAGIGAGIEAGGQLYQGEFDPARLATQTAAGAVFTNPYKWGQRLEQAGQRAGEQIGERLRVEPHGSPAPQTAAGASESHIPSTVGEETIGDPQNKVTRSGHGEEYLKPKPTETGEPTGVTVLKDGEPDPTLGAAIKAAQPLPPEAPTEFGAKLDAQFPRAEVPESQIRPMEPTRAPGPVDQATMGRAADEQVAANQAAGDTVRFYHGGEDPTSGGPRYLTPDQEYARNFRSQGEPNQVHYVDVPRQRLQGDLAAGYDDINQIYRHFEAPEDIARQLKPVSREPTTVPADHPSVVPEEAVQRDVLERGRSGRPIRTEPLPIGTEQQILERGAQRVEEGPRPGEVPPPEIQAMARKGAPPTELPEGFTLRETPGGRHILEQNGRFRGDFPTAKEATTQANRFDYAAADARIAEVAAESRRRQGLPPIAETVAPPEQSKLTIVKDGDRHLLMRGDELVQGYPNRGAALRGKAAVEKQQAAAVEAGPVKPEPVMASAALDTKVAEALAAPPTKGAELKAQQAAKVTEAEVGGTGRPPPSEPPKGPPSEPSEPAPKGPDRPKFLDEVVQRPRRLLEELQNVFAPHLRSEAAGSLRQRAIKEAGTTQSVADKAENLMAQHDPTIEAMNPERRQQFKDWFEAGGKGDFKPTEAEEKAASALKIVGTMWEGQIGRLGRAEGMDFIKNYLPHMYKNPEAAEKFVNDYAANIKGGGAGSLRKRFFETEAAARAAGHEPLSDNPFDLFRRYGESMKQFVAKEALREHVVDSGIGQYAAPPKVVGASGSPEPQVKSNIPPGWVPSQTAPVKNGQQLYLPEDIVRVFDRFNGERGLAEKYPTLYGAAKAFNTGWNKVLLAVSGYHFATMANEGMMSELTRAGQLIGAGKWGEAGQTAAGAWKAPYSTPKLGGKVQEAYLSLNSPEAAKRLGLDGDVIDAMAKGGLRFVGSKHTPELNMGENAKGSYIKAKGDWMDTIKSIPDQMSQGLKDAKSEWLDSKGNVPDATKYAFRQIGRVIDTTAEALFNVYIPKMKTGAAYKEIKQWKDLNPDVSVHSEEGMKAVNKIISNIDDRFGEMATSRTFINKTVQDAATAGMTSYSWVLGSMKGIGGGGWAGVKSGLEGGYKFAKGDKAGAMEALGRISPTNKDFDPRIAYVPALMAQTALMSTFYQAIFGSHDAPEGWRDLYAPRTGGTIPGFGGKGQIPEHMLVPGFQKDIYGYAAHPLQEAYGKVGSGWKTIMEQLSNSDWRGQPIVRPNATALDWINDRATHVTKQFGPLSAKNWIEGGPEGSRIPAPLRAAGFRATSKEFSDPDRAQILRNKRETKAWKLKTRTENREARERGRPEPYPAGAAS